MSLRFSHTSFPCTPDQRDAMQLPWGMVLQPLAPLTRECVTRVESRDVARCSSCFAYINPFVTWTRGSSWKCALCRSLNSLAAERYGGAIEQRLRLPELRLADVEYVWSDETAATEKAQAAAAGGAADDAAAAAAQAEAEALAAFRAAQDPSSSSYDPSATLSAPYAPSSRASLSPPAYLFVVDLSGESGVVETLKASLLAAIEALPPAVWVGLCVVSGRVGLYDLRCATPSVSYVRVRAADAAARFGTTLEEAPLSLPLAALMPLDCFLQRLEHCKERLAAAIESLTSHAPTLDLQQLAREEDGTDDFEAGGAQRKKETAKEQSGDRADAVNPFGFGAAMSALLSYLSSVEDAGFEVNVRMLCFLSQRPNWGLGALPARVGPGVDESLNEEDWDRFLYAPNDAPMAWSSRTQTISGAAGDSAHAQSHASIGAVSRQSCAEFYRSLGSRASTHGICIDLYVLPLDGAQHLDLATLKHLSLLSGGNLLYYPSLRECSLPQDLFRQLRLLQAFRCLLRLRTSPEMAPTNVYGHLVADDTHEGLFHVGGCDARKVYAVELEFVGSEGFRGGYVDVNPVIQVAFSYIGLVVGADGESRVEHRLRVLTRQMPLVHHYVPSAGARAQQEALRQRSMAQSVRELYAASAPEILLTLLVHQVVHASLERGLAESRALLREWLVRFLIGYHAVCGAASASAASPSDAESSPDEGKDDGSSSTPLLSSDTLDVSLSGAPQLQFLPRFLFALLKSPLLAASRHVLPPDARVYLQVLYAGLEPDYLVKSVYPTLTSFAHSGDGRLEPHHPVLYLTRHSVSGCGDAAFLLDAYTALHVLYTGPLAADRKSFPLPPPAHTEVALAIKRIKAATPYITPRLTCAADTAEVGAMHSQPFAAQSADASLRAFYAQLIEDEEGGTGGYSYAQFMQEIAARVVAERRA